MKKLTAGFMMIVGIAIVGGALFFYMEMNKKESTENDINLGQFNKQNAVKAQTMQRPAMHQPVAVLPKQSLNMKPNMHYTNQNQNMPTQSNMPAPQMNSNQSGISMSNRMMPMPSQNASMGTTQASTTTTVDPASLVLTTTNFLENLSSSQVNQIQFVYDNNGVKSQREVFVTIGGSSTSGQMPLIFVLHGTALNGVEAAMKSAQDELGQNSIVVAPVGSQKSDGMYSWNANGTTTSEDDMAFVEAMFNLITNDPRINGVYIAGNSVGSLFCNYLAAGSLSINGALFYSSQTPVNLDLTSASPKNVVFFNGAQDSIINSEGGVSKVGETFRSVKSSVEAWAKQNGCTGEIIVDTSNSEFTLYSAQDCNGFVTKAYVFTQGTHNSIKSAQDHLGLQTVTQTIEEMFLN
jgi:poly(3-hydroxybutyrate) depolymerase